MAAKKITIPVSAVPLRQPSKPKATTLVPNIADGDLT